MGASSVVQTQHRATKVIGPSIIQDVMEVGATTIPSQVFFVVDVPYETWKALGSEAYIDPVAADIESWLNRPGVVGADFVQDTNAAGLVIGYIEFILTPTSMPPGRIGPMTSSVLVPISSFGNPEFAGIAIEPIFDAAWAALNATARL